MAAQEKYAHNREQYRNIKREDYDQGENNRWNLSAAPLYMMFNIVHQLSPTTLTPILSHSLKSKQESAYSYTYLRPPIPSIS